MLYRNILILIWAIMLSLVTLQETFADEIAAATSDREPVEENQDPTEAGTAKPEMAVADPDDIEEVIVEADSPSDPDPISMVRRRNDSGRGAKYYIHGDYDKAFPLLLRSAKSGFKVAQARVSYLYQRGLGVTANAEAAIGWIGAAASRTSHPSIINYYRKFISQIPEAYMPQVEDIVEEYITRYGSRAVGMNCSNTRMAGTHLSRLKCDFKDEFSFQDVLDDGSIASGIEATGSYSGSGN